MVTPGQWRSDSTKVSLKLSVSLFDNTQRLIQNGVVYRPKRKVNNDWQTKDGCPKCYPE